MNGILKLNAIIDVKGSDIERVTDAGTKYLFLKSRGDKPIRIDDDSYKLVCKWIDESNRQMEIKRCPFCDGVAEVRNSIHRDGNAVYDTAFVRCKKCGARSGSFEINGPDAKGNFAERCAIVAWNRRTGDDVLA